MKKIYRNILSIATVATLPLLWSCGESDEPKSDNNQQQETPADGMELADMTSTDLEQVATNPDLDEIIVNYEGFTVSFNPTMHMPNWVAWTITKEKLNNPVTSRTDDFRVDNNVAGCATLADYKYSGYDRGHMAPAADMKWSTQAMYDCFYLTNICPQLHDLNGGAWEDLEEKCRTNAKRDGRLIVVAGPVLTEGFSKYIGTSPVPVPDKYFKVIFTPETSNGPQAIGFVMPNATVSGGMQATAVSVDEVETLTGHDFFHLLSNSVEDALEAEVNYSRFNTGR